MLRLTRKMSVIRMTDTATTLGCVFEYRNMMILDPDTQKKTRVLNTAIFILKKSLKKSLFQTGNYSILKS